MSLRNDRLKTNLKKLTAHFLQSHSDTTVLTTVTDFTISKDLRNATAFISVYPENKEKEVLNYIRKQRKDFWKYLATKTKMRRIPFVEFEIDMGEKNRQRVEKLLQE